MQAWRVWSTWKDNPEDDAIASGAFQLLSRAQTFADDANAEHAKQVGPGSTCRYVVREETVPRNITFKGKPDRVVMVFLGEDPDATDVSQVQGR